MRPHLTCWIWLYALLISSVLQKNGHVSDPYNRNHWVTVERAWCVSQDRISYAAVTNDARISIAFKQDFLTYTHVQHSQVVFTPGPRLVEQPLSKTLAGKRERGKHVPTLKAFAQRWHSSVLFTFRWREKVPRSKPPSSGGKHNNPPPGRSREYFWKIVVYFSRLTVYNYKNKQTKKLSNYDIFS